MHNIDWMSCILLKRERTELRHRSLKCWSAIGSFSSSRRDQSHEPVHTRDQANFEGTSPCDWSHEFKPVWFRGTNFGDQNSVPATRFLTKIGRSHGGTWSPGPVHATGPCDRSPRVLQQFNFLGHYRHTFSMYLSLSVLKCFVTFGGSRIINSFQSES